MSSFDSYSGIEDLVNKYRKPKSSVGRGPTNQAGSIGHMTAGGGYYRPSNFGAGSSGIGTSSRSSLSGGDWEQMLMDSLLRDSGEMQGAADRQFGRNEGQIGAYEDMLSGGMADIRAGGQAAMGQADQAIAGLQNPQDSAVSNLMGMAGQLSSMIPQLLQFSQGPINEGMDTARQMRGEATDFLGNVPDLAGDAMAGYQRGEQEYGDYRGAISEFKQDSWSDASAIAEGIRSNMRDQEAMATSSFNPDGTPKTAAQQAQDRYMFGQMAQTQTSQVMSQYAGQIREGVANMRTQLSNLGIQVAGMRGDVANARNQEAILRISGMQQLGAAAALMNQSGELGIRAGETAGNLASQAAQITAQAEGVRLEYQQLQNGWREFKANIMSSLPITALQLEMTGRKDIATFVQQNPESVISWFESLLGLYSATSAAKGTTGYGSPGGGNNDDKAEKPKTEGQNTGWNTWAPSTGSAIREANQWNQQRSSIPQTGYGQSPYTNTGDER